MSGAKIRLDQLLVDLGHFHSRARARDAVQRGTVQVDGSVVTKPGQTVAAGANIAIDDPAARYVSRAALKLVAALDAFAFHPAGKTCLDVGASTGGFTQVLLERGARHVTAIDVGHGQLHESLHRDPRVTSIEGLNARDLTLAHIGEPPEIVVSDVSFISLTLALAPALDLAAPGARLAALVKPQFEVGREGIGKGGLVRSPELADEALQRIIAWIGGLDGWQVVGHLPSPITGGDGNREFLLGAQKT
ncbi:16S/23S rRNA (cytidine-2'-O)-methyltransferase TlyA [Hartmannibacter diazotrophicus]|uniref:16S/23S rRNA (Cytidine-2'-O)-methyltransferase TlyA n=1 Tax=Hartmannibacter diazotrophicus TaxID=1482074 RepID=A0A2C9D339_9HYPH|nr:TlyA family RNA methyltransferase [Hartmannibacter diazotrophicus]SON54747.1 16S/23S rRNA (cytidine-2'-O)-methyltransferase TlyA [Hartmannibacter diazotrophicus]